MFWMTPSRIFSRSSSLKIAPRRAAIVVDEDVGRRAGGEERCLARRAADVGDDRLHLDREARGNLGGGRFHRGAVAAVDDDIAARLGKRQRAAATEAAARSANDRLPAGDSQIHAFPSSLTIRVARSRERLKPGAGRLPACHGTVFRISYMRGVPGHKGWPAPMLDRPNPRHFRTLFLSDVHLGSKACQARLLLDFLRCHDAETFYLVGDIVDGWRLKRSWYWPQEHNDVVQKLLRKGRKGSRIVYIPGNHDEFLRDYHGHAFRRRRGRGEGGARHRGRPAAPRHPWRRVRRRRPSRPLARLSSASSAYEVAVSINTVLNRIRRRLGFGYWSLSAWLKLKVKNAVNYIGAFEEALSNEARRAGADGVVCGHIHHARIADSNRLPLRQHRRLGGELHGRRRAPRRQARDHLLAGRPCRSCGRRGSRWRPASPARRPSEAPPHRHRRLAAAGQRRRADARAHGRRTAAHGRRGGRAHARRVSARFPARPIPRSGWRLTSQKTIAAGDRGGAARRHPHRHRGAGRGGRPALVPAPRPASSRRAITRAFPNTSRERAPIPLQLTYALLRRFHNAGAACMVATPSLERDLRGARLPQPRALAARRRLLAVPAAPGGGAARSAAAGLSLCRPRLGREERRRLPRPRSAREQGRHRRRSGAAGAPRRAIPRRDFLGVLAGEALAEVYAQADVFVFPSRTDTFGIVLLEALASGRAGRGLPGGRAGRRGRLGRGRRPRRGSPCRRHRRPRYPARTLPDVRSRPYLAGKRAPVPRQYPCGAWRPAARWPP